MKIKALIISVVLVATTSVTADVAIESYGQNPMGEITDHTILINTFNNRAVIFNTDSSRFGIMKYTEEKDALRVTVKPGESDHHQEWLAYEIEKTGHYTANVNLRWENLVVGFTVETPKADAGGADHSNH